MMKMDTVDTIAYRDFEIKIYPEELEDSPRDWDNLGTMTCFHRRYDLGDKTDLSSDSFGSWKELHDYLKKEEHAAIILPLYLLDHSGITMRVGHGFGDVDPQGWDWGQVGFIWVSREKILQEFSKKRLSKELLEKTETILRSEIETYDQYLGGEVYGYCINELNDSCWGFYGHNWEENGLLDYARKAIDCWHEDTEKMQAEAHREEIGLY